MKTEEFGLLFNSPLEAGIRTVVILEHLRPQMLDLSDLVLFDHIVVHTNDVGGPDSLHPALSGRNDEPLIRRQLIESSLDLMRKCHLVEQVHTDDGIVYRASEEAAAYIDLLEATYSQRLKACAEWIARQVEDLTKEKFVATARKEIRNWDEAFHHQGGSAEPA